VYTNIQPVVGWMFVYDTAGCHSQLSNRVVQPVWQPCWRNSHCSFNQLSNLVVFIQLVVKPRCTTLLTTGCIHDTAGCQTGCLTGLTTGWVFVYTIHRVYKHLTCCQTRLTTGCIV